MIKRVSGSAKFEGHASEKNLVELINILLTALPKTGGSSKQAKQREALKELKADIETS